MPQAAAGLTLEAVSAAPRALGKGRKRGRIVRRRITALTWGNPAAITARCVLVTTASAPSMAVIHHRQPLCLEGDEIAAWLDPTTPLGDIGVRQHGPHGASRRRRGRHPVDAGGEEQRRGRRALRRRGDAEALRAAQHAPRGAPRPASHNPENTPITIDLAKHILHIDGVAVGALIGRLGSAGD